MSDISLKIGVRTAHAGLSNSSVWADGDEMGLFMMASGQSNLSLGMEYNRKYTYSAGGAAFFLSGQPIYYPTTGQVDIVAYAPYRQVTGNTLSIDLLDQHDLRSLDLLYSNSSIGIVKSKEEVDLNFKHMLSKINFNLTAGLGGFSCRTLISADFFGRLFFRRYLQFGDCSPAQCECLGHNSCGN